MPGHYKKPNNKQKKDPMKNLLKIFGINNKMQNRAGGGGTTSSGQSMSLSEIRRRASGR